MNPNTKEATPTPRMHHALHKGAHQQDVNIKHCTQAAQDVYSEGCKLEAELTASNAKLAEQKELTALAKADASAFLTSRNNKAELCNELSRTIVEQRKALTLAQAACASKDEALKMIHCFHSTCTENAPSETCSACRKEQALAPDCAQPFVERLEKLAAFKTWVHEYLDAHSVPHHPPGTHGAEGCRIGDRMDWLMEQRDAALARVQRVEATLTRYGKHDIGCGCTLSFGRKCSCGLKALSAPSEGEGKQGYCIICLQPRHDGRCEIAELPTTKPAPTVAKSAGEAANRAWNPSTWETIGPDTKAFWEELGQAVIEWHRETSKP